MRERRLLERLSYWEQGASRTHQTEAEILIRSVSEHLRRLLNTRKGGVPLDPLYGVPDLTNVAGGLSSGAVTDITQEIENTIRRYEPRLKHPKVAFSTNPQLPEVFSLTFSLSGEVEVDHQLIPLNLSTRLDSSGKVNLA